jgi:polyferredoxin
MDRMGYPKGLVSYTTQNAMDGKNTRIIRARTILYGALLFGMFVLFFYALMTREPLHLDVIRDRNALYRELPGNQIENVYTLKLLNKSEVDHVMRFTASGLPQIEIFTDPEEFILEGGQVLSIAARVRVSGTDLAPGGHDIVLTATEVDGDQLAAVREARFIAPSR